MILFRSEGGNFYAIPNKMIFTFKKTKYSGMNDKILLLIEEISSSDGIVRDLTEQLDEITTSNGLTSQAINSINGQCTVIRNDTADVRPCFKIIM